MIIDSHTHIYPEAKASKTIKTVKERAGILSYSDGTVKGLLASMAKSGIDLSIVSNIATRTKQVKSINQWLEQFSAQKTLALATWHPDLPVKPEELSALKQKGFKGFKFHPDYQDFFVDDRRMFPFYEAAAMLGLPILFHAGLDLGLPDPIHCTPQGLRNVLEMFPGLRLIAAHMGGDQAWEETEKQLLGRDIYLDTSFVLRKIPPLILERFFKKHPIERFLFGSDSPWGGQKEDLEFFLSLPFPTDREKEMVLGQNAAKLYGIEPLKPEKLSRVSPLFPYGHKHEPL